MKAPFVTGLFMTVGLLLVMGMVVPAIQAETAPVPLAQEKTALIKFMGGTIEEVDLAGLRITIQTEMGKKESFPVSSAAVMQGLTKGDLVNVELDEQGKALTIVKSDFAPRPVPEAPKPAPEPKG